MRKLAVVVMILALAMFMASMASAQDRGLAAMPGEHPLPSPAAIQGTYQMSASGSCLHSSLEYFKNPANGRWTAPSGSQVYAGVTVANGTWIFEDGEGTFSQTIYATILPGGDVSIPIEVRVLAQKDVPFTYEVTPSGDLTVTAGGIKLFGSLSMDKKTITLLSANNVQNLPAPFWFTICNTTRTLIKVRHVGE